MVIANVLNTYTTVAGLWQYDYGQVLRIQGLTLPTAAEIHFSLSERGGQAVTRVGTTRDNVTDVVIPDSMLENADTTADYKIYAFIYLTDSESGQTEYKISMPVKSRPRPESFERQEDAELFRTAIAEVNKSATSAQESATKSATAKDESIAASKEAKQSAEAASVSAQASKNSADASKGSEKTASSAATEAVNAKDIAVKAADSAYNSALASRKSAQEAQTSAQQADTASKSAAQSKQDIQELKTAIDNTAEQIATDRTAVETDKKEVQKAKSDVEDLKSAVEQKSSEVLVDLENTEVVIKKNINNLKDVVIEKGNEAISGIETARDNAINDVNNAKDTAVSAITQEKESAVNAVNDAKDNVVAEINENENVQQIKENKDDIAEAQKDIEELKDKKITKFYANNLGETHLEDSDSGKIQDMFLYGKSEQKQYTGKNLLELSDNRVQNGNLKFQISQGIITFSGSTDNASFIEKIKDFIVPSDGTYTISTNSDSDNESPRILLSINGGSFESALNGATKELTTADVVSLYIRISTIDSYNGRTIKPMIEKGSNVTSYEPYTGGQPSPSPDYPQEIKSVVNPTIKLSNEDGTKSQTVTLPYTLNAIPVSKDGNVTINGQQYIADYVDVERGKLVRNVREVDFSTCIKEKDYYNILDNSKEIRYSYNNLKIKQQPKGAIYNNGGGFINAFTLITSTVWNKDQIGISSHAQGSNNMLSIRIPVDREANEYFDEIGGCKGLFEIDTPEEIDLTQEEIEAFKELATYYPVTNISVTSDQLDGYTTFNYPVSMKNGWDYVKQQLNDNRDYIYDMDAKTQDIDTQSAEAYVNSEYAVALTELEVM